MSETPDIDPLVKADVMAFVAKLAADSGVEIDAEAVWADLRAVDE